MQSKPVHPLLLVLQAELGGELNPMGDTVILRELDLLTAGRMQPGRWALALDQARGELLIYCNWRDHRFSRLRLIEPDALPRALELVRQVQEQV